MRVSQLKAVRSMCRGFREVWGLSTRRAISEMALHGAATSCLNLLAATVPVQVAILEPDVISPGGAATHLGGGRHHTEVVGR